MMSKVSPLTGQSDYPGDRWLITSGYCTDDYFERFGDWHTGHDLALSREGGETIYAVADGVIKWAENAGDNGFGNLVVIEHNVTLYSRYAHLNEISVTLHQQVKSGDPIGTLGSTGRSTGPHLHFDLMRVNNALDWPGKDKDRLLRTYINPDEWYGRPTDFYVIKAGDTLSLIAARFNTTVAVLQELNNIANPNMIAVGQRLTLPGTGKKPDEATVVVSPGQSEWLRITATAGLNARKRPSTRAAILYTLPFSALVEVKSVQFLEQGFTWRELMSGGWIAQEFTEPVAVLQPGEVAGEEAAATVAASATVFVTPRSTPVATVEVASRGVHGSAGGWAPGDDELNLIRHNGVDSVLIAAYERGQAESASPRYRSAGVRDFIIRAATAKRNITANPDDFVDATLPTLREYQEALGDTKLILAVHNEPNVSVEGFGTAWKNGTDFTRWYLAVIRRYRDELPGVRIGFPALSPGGDLDLPEVKRMDEWRFVAQCGEAIAASDWVGVHAYFVGDGTDIDLKPDLWRQMAHGRSVIITEGGPADHIPNSGQKLHNVYMRCAEIGVPVMAWLLSGAGAWESADWVKRRVRI